MNSKYAFEVKNAAKHYGDVKALDGVSLKAEQGKVYGLLGPNGAGKTTLVRMLSTLLEPTTGSIKVLGIDAVQHPGEVRKIIGLAGQYAAVDEFLTGYENIYMIGRLYRLGHKEAKQRALELLRELSLEDAANRQVKTYSGGMRRRLDLGASLVGQPKILFLDEPTTGLDPRTRLELWHIIRELVKKGTSILLTTQYLEEADELADHIAVIDHGKLIVEGTSDQLKSHIGGDVVEFEVADKHQAQAIETVKKFGFKKPSINEHGHIALSVKDGNKKLVDIIKALDNAKIRPQSISLHRPTLDDVFLSVTGRKTEDNKQLARGGKS